MLYLASTSPRRHDLLAQAGIPFTACQPGPEPRGQGEPRQRAVLRAQAKALGAKPPGGAGLILAVDTVVELLGSELGKPAGQAEAQQMLWQLSGREHLVHSAHCLLSLPGGRVDEACATARVRCRELDQSRLAAYLAAGEWRGKAGAYAIQGSAAAFMQLLEGQVDTVIGLNVETVRRLLSERGWSR